VRLRGLSAAGLCATLALLAGGCGEARLAHTCSATDKQFISTAQLNIASLDLWAQQYLSGAVKARVVVDQARQAAATVSRTDPRDPSLATTRLYLDAMFTEYGRAVQARSRNRDAGPHMYRAYGLANFARDVLVQAQPALRAQGCDVAPLL
jgi:hypothetical protein